MTSSIFNIFIFYKCLEHLVHRRASARPAERSEAMVQRLVILLYFLIHLLKVMVSFYEALHDSLDILGVNLLQGLLHSL